MPPKKKSNGRKKNTRKPRVTKNAVINRGLAPLAPRFITKLNYVVNDQSLVSTLGSTGDYQFRLNSLFDPDLTGGGHQPMGFDQITPLYNRYRVFSVSYRITFYPQAGATFVYYILPNNTNASLTGVAPSTVIEQGRCIQKFSNTTHPTVFSGHLSLNRLNGVTSAVYMADDRYQALSTASPGEEMIMHVMASASAGATSTTRFDLKLQYHAEFFDPHDLNQS